MGTFRHPSGQWMNVPDEVLDDYLPRPAPLDELTGEDDEGELDDSASTDVGES